MCNPALYYAAAAVAAAGSAAYSADSQRKAAHQSADAMAAAQQAGQVAPTAQAYMSPDADATPVTRARLKVDLNSSLPKARGSGLTVGSSSSSSVSLGPGGYGSSTGAPPSGISVGVRG